MDGGALEGLLASWGLATALPDGLDLDKLAGDALGPGESVHLMGLDLTRESALATLTRGR